MSILSREGFPLDPGGLRGCLARTMYGIGHTLSALLFGWVWRRRVLGREHVPHRGAVIVAPNHASLADPPLVGSSVPRPIYFMAKEELFDVPLLGWIIARVNAFPVRRSGHDAGAVRTALAILEGGGAVVVFPEGARQKSDDLGKPRPGVGLLALKSGAPVVPVYVRNSRRLPRLTGLDVVFGEPLRADPGDTAESLSRRVMDAIRSLKEAGPPPR